MKQFLTILFSVFSLQLLACGEYYTGEDFYYHLFDQKGMVDASLQPFIYYLDFGFYQQWDSKRAYEENRNLNDWYSYFDEKVSLETLDAILNGSTDETALDEIDLPKQMKADFITYLILAKKVDRIADISYDEAWEPSLKNVNEKDLKAALYTEILNANEFYKLRYVYQLSKLALVNDNSPEIMRLHAAYVKSSTNRAAIYYYLLDHYAYALARHQPDEAAKLYLTNFVELPERRLSEYNSIRFTIKKDNIKALSVPQEYEPAKVFLHGFRNGVNHADLLEELIQIDIKSEFTTLALVRALNNELRNLASNKTSWLSVIQCDEKKTYQALKEYDYASYYDLKSDLDRLDKIIIAAIKKSKNKDQWILAQAQIEFLKGNAEASSQLAKQVMKSKKPAINRQAELLLIFNTLKQMHHLGVNEEVGLEQLLSQLKGFSTKSDENEYIEEVEFGYDSEQYFWEIVAKKYYDQADYAKSFLAINAALSLNHYRDECVIKDLQNFMQKPSKSAFEKTLVKKFGHSNPDLVLKDYLATTHVYKFEFDEAIELYREITNAGNEFETLEKFNAIPKHIFASTYAQCYECEFEEIMTEQQASKIESGIFDTKLELLERVKALRKSAQPSDQLAYGNFLLNINRKGYYRDLFAYVWSNGTNRNFVATPNELGFGSVLPIDYEATKEVFQFVLNSKKANKEQKAMAAWGIVQAEQALFEDSYLLQRTYGDYEYYDWVHYYNEEEFVDFEQKIEPFYNAFEAYGETQFHKEIIRECSYYQTFVNR